MHKIKLYSVAPLNLYEDAAEGIERLKNGKGVRNTKYKL